MEVMMIQIGVYKFWV